jgi:hypothetical protein
MDAGVEFGGSRDRRDRSAECSRGKEKIGEQSAAEYCIESGTEECDQCISQQPLKMAINMISTCLFSRLLRDQIELLGRD